VPQKELIFGQLAPQPSLTTEKHQVLGEMKRQRLSIHADDNYVDVDADVDVVDADVDDDKLAHKLALAERDVAHLRSRELSAAMARVTDKELEVVCEWWNAMLMRHSTLTSNMRPKRQDVNSSDGRFRVSTEWACSIEFPNILQERNVDKYGDAQIYFDEFTTLVGHAEYFGTSNGVGNWNRAVTELGKHFEPPAHIMTLMRKMRVTMQVRERLKWSFRDPSVADERSERTSADPSIPFARCKSQEERDPTLRYPSEDARNQRFGEYGDLAK
jgi:hypothetical protein